MKRASFLNHCSENIITASLKLSPKFPQYARVLGFNKIGQEILSQSKKATNILVTSNFKNIAKNFPYSSNLDSKATDLFMFSQKSKKPCGLDYTKKPIINL